MTETSLTGGQRVFVAVAVAGMLAAGGYGLTISYFTVYELAVDLHMPLPAVFPLGIEGGMIAVLALDLVLTWVRHPIGWLRQVARALSAAAIGINAAAGWEHGPLAVVMHAIAPVILITGVEALRHRLLRMVADADELRRDPIPRARWLLAPVSTAAMWRRMVLWQVASYADALDADLARREIVHALRREFGRRWHREIPADVAYRIRAGVRMDGAIEAARSLIAERRPVVVDDLGLLPIGEPASEVFTVALEVTGEDRRALTEGPTGGAVEGPVGGARSGDGEPTGEVPAVSPVNLTEGDQKPSENGSEAPSGEPRQSKPGQRKRRTRSARRSTSPVNRRTTEDRARELDALIRSGDLTEDASVNRIRTVLRCSPDNARAAIRWRAEHLTGEATGEPVDDPTGEATERVATPDDLSPDRVLTAAR